MHPPKCAQNLEQRLAALRRDQEIDGLRVYLIKYNLFPRNRDPHNSPIRVEELKELVKHWKLHRQRGFWRDHPEKDDLVRALLQHIRTEASSKKRRQDAQDKFRKVNGCGDVDDADQPVQANAMSSSASAPGLLSPSSLDPRQRNPVSMDDKLSTGDLFYTRGHYDEGLIYLSRMEKSKQVHKLQREQNEDMRVVAEKELDLLAHLKDKESTANLSKDMKLKCAEGLYNVSCYPHNEAQMLAEGAVPIVSGLLKNLGSDDVHVRLYCAATLLNLSMTAGSRALMIDQGAIPLVLELAHANNITSKLFCAHTLFRFSGDEDMHFHLVHDGCVIALLQLMAVANDELKELCMKALINLSVIPRSTSSDTVMSTLISLVKVDNPATNLVCAKGLLNLSIMPTTRVNVVEDGAMLALKILCSYHHIQVCELASAVLCNLAAVRTNQESMVKNGALAVLVELFELPHRYLAKQAPTSEGGSSSDASTLDLHGLYVLKAKWIQNESASLTPLTPDQSVMLDIHMQCAITLSYFSCNAKVQPRLVSAGFVPRVLALLTMHHDDTTKVVTLILSNLASHESCRVQMVADGCVRPLISLMSSTKVDMVVKQDCVVALCNLMLHPQTYKTMVDDGVVPALVAYSENPHPDIQKSCAFALLSLTMDKGMKAKLVGQGVIVALINLADRCADRVDLRAACVCALFQLSTDIENAAALFYEGTQTVAITVLTEPISTTQPAVSHRMWMHSLALLSNMASYDKGRSVLVDDGAVDAVLRFLQVHTTVRSKACARYLTRAQSFAASMLGKLVDVAMMHPGYFAALLALTSTQTISSSSSSRSDVSAMVKTLRCALAFSWMSGTMKGRRLLANHPDVAPGLNSMMRTGHHETQLYAAIGLCNLAMERGATPDRIWADTTVSDFIVVALLRVNSDETKLKCAQVLFNLLTHDDTREKLVVDGVLYALIKLAKLEIDTIRELCLQSIYNISLELGKVQRLVDMEIVRILSTMFQADHSKEMKRLVCGILSNVSAVAGNERQLLHEGCALTTIASLVKARDPETRVYCANALSNLSCNAQVAEFMLKDDGNIVAILISLSRAESKDIRRYATGAISNLSASRLGVEVMTRESMIGAIRELLNRITCDVTLALCVRALRNLMMDTENQTKLVACHGLQLVEDGIVRALTAIAKQTPASPSAKLDIISCFSALSKNPLGHDQMLKDGIMEAIVNLCLDSDDQSTTLRASLIARIGEEFAYHMILTMRNLTSTKDTMQASHAEGAPPVLSHDVNRARVSSQSNAIAILLACATSSQPDTREHVAVTLYNLSCHRRSRGLIISNEGVKVLIRLGQNAGGPNAVMMKQVCALALQSMSTHQDANIMQPGLILAMTASLSELNVMSMNAQMSETIAKKTAAVVAPTQFLKNRTLTTFLVGANFVVHHRGTPADWTQVPAKLPPDDGIQVLFQADDEAEADEQNVDNEQVLAASAPRACNLDATCGTLTCLQDDELVKNKMLLGPNGQDIFLGRTKHPTGSGDVHHSVALPLPNMPAMPETSTAKTDPEVVVTNGRSSAAQVRKEATKTLKPATPPSPVRSPSKKQLQQRLEPIQ
ncbi:hypothetical protein DYB37_003332 [Aphanomyces astaci]|uniref:Uncharacterized protein n=1 Tax=Aphanomyces astaci TaxID=112090 RepID=A0A397CQN1_APHAT|nr:hypothetical protein DYB30_002231 [Aphanomyces astaci]RHZ25080.1 hypothetical protein DYB37_003332 [Aphanomyces astaci]